MLDPIREFNASRLFNQLDNKRNVIGGIIIFVLFLFMLMIFLVHHNSSEITTSARQEGSQASIIMNELSDINSSMNKLATNPQNSKAFQQALVQIDIDVASIKKSMGSLAKVADVQQVSTQISSMQTDVDNQMTDLQKAIVTGGEVKQFVNPRVLPFKVLSIDVISEQPYVTIRYHDLITALGIGDSVDGWRIVAADYDAELAEFKNIKSDKYVKVSLQD